MPSRDKNKRVRLPSITARMSEIRGVSREEKWLLTRIGNLVDALVENRNIANSGEARGRQLSNKVPKPETVEATVITGGIEVVWSAVNFNEFDKYEVQHDSTSTFANATTIPVFTNRVVIKGFSSNTVFIRVRTVSRRGQVSEFASPVGGGVTIPTVIFDADTDHIDPENRTRIVPQPRLLGKSLSAQTGARALVGVGAAVGPGPISFFDPSGDVGGDGSTGNNAIQFRNQINYALLENSATIQTRTAGILSHFYDGFYENVNRLYTSASGSFMDFFSIEALNASPTVLDVRFLDYLKTPHEQTGTVNQASMGIIEH